ncbi:MAG TPA: hypothetical protein VMC10_25490 [Stellaceae bacterium]|nr:hypothetical protein [Stellaceae bacterium]
MRTVSLPRVIALAFGALAGAASADAQTPVCPPGYYYASDGQCYPGAQPAYPPPAYAVAPPVYQPPIVFDGLAIGLGLGALIGAAGHHGDGHRGGGDHGRR